MRVRESSYRQEEESNSKENPVFSYNFEVALKKGLAAKDGNGGVSVLLEPVDFKTAIKV